QLHGSDHQGRVHAPTEGLCEEEERLNCSSGSSTPAQVNRPAGVPVEKAPAGSTGILKATIISTSRHIQRARATISSESSAPLSECSSSSLIFIVCWMPFTLMYLIRGLNKATAVAATETATASKIVEVVQELAIWLGYAKQRSQPHSVPPIFNKDFRLAFKKLTMCRVLEDATAGAEKVRSKSVIDHSSGKSGRQAAAPGSVPRQSCRSLVGSAGQVRSKKFTTNFCVCKICHGAVQDAEMLGLFAHFLRGCASRTTIASEAAYRRSTRTTGEFTCPLCRSGLNCRLEALKKLPDNFLISNLFRHDGTGRKCPDTPTCDESAHDPWPRSSRTAANRKTSSARSTKMRWFDSTASACQACICIILHIQRATKTTTVSNFSEAVVKYKADIEGILVDCKIYEKYVERVAGTERQITERSTKIRELAIEFIS
uniref:RING-type domain-containing protein n=1 Tax=Macrostomum lignano TaxID=282301 RepID=A0A1I8FRR8_9PLAT